MAMEKNDSSKYQLVIGLEIHVQLKTKSKIFAGESANFGEEANKNISVVTLAHPGALPKLNKEVIELAIRMGLACNCEIATDFIFDRKNYFYPDSPKGYQLTQDRTPICQGGNVAIKTKGGISRSVELFKIHLEEDAGKSIHTMDSDKTNVDFNRSGVPLIEMVTKPDLFSAEEASALLSEVRRIVRYLDISDGNMEEGSMRCDANISVKLKGSDELGKKVEIKNMNSLRNVSRAIDYEFKRQVELLGSNEEIISETRTFNADNGTTASMRDKEELNDYRYFPEPDLSGVALTDEFLEKIKRRMPPLPSVMREQFMVIHGLPSYDAEVLTEDKGLALFAEHLLERTGHKKTVSNWLMGPVKSHLNEHAIGIDEFPISAENLLALVDLIEEGKVNHSAASQKIFPALLEENNKGPLDIAQNMGLIQNSDTGSLQPLIDEVLVSMPDKVDAYKKGKKGLIGLFMGEVMKRTNGGIDPKTINQMLRDSLE